MNNKVVVGILIVLVLLVGGWYFMTQKNSPKGELIENKDTVKEESSTTSLKDLFTKGVAQTCTYTMENGNGKVYVAGGAMRGDFETKVEGKDMTSHMIVKDNTSYIWTDDNKTGLKMSFDPNTIDDSESTNSPVQGQGVDMTSNYNYKCGAWIKDSSKFDLPSGVSFSSFDIPVTKDGGAPSQCSYCNALTGDDKTQCEQALKCN